jgi:hypothetical protein
MRDVAGACPSGQQRTPSPPCSIRKKNAWQAESMQGKNASFSSRAAFQRNRGLGSCAVLPLEAGIFFKTAFPE